MQRQNLDGKQVGEMEKAFKMGEASTKLIKCQLARISGNPDANSLSITLF